MKRILLTLIILPNFIFAQSNLTVNVNGIKNTDTITVMAQRGVEDSHELMLYGSIGSQVVFNDLAAGKWAVKIDATGYSYESTQVIEIPTQTQVNFNLVEFTGNLFSYEWRDDESFAGHSQQAYVNAPLEITFLEDTITIPDDYNSLKLANKYGVILNNDESAWSDENAFKLLNNIGRLPFTEKWWGDKINEKYSYIISLTDEFIENDIQMSKVDDVWNVRISTEAFTYSNPQSVIIDGLRGNYFSNRLYSAIVRLYTENGNDSEAIAKIAQENFGIEFLVPSEELETLMGEDQSNFQEFFREEKLLILAMLEELPEGMHAQAGLKYFVRRINGQDNPAYPDAPAIAWTTMNTIEYMEKAFNLMTMEYMQRLILHEKTHLLWAYTFDDDLKDDWAELGGWFEDPTSSTGWSTTKTTEFVSTYAHSENPNEDMAESVAFFVQNPDMLKSRSLGKYEFVRDRIMHGTRYVSVIREDLTFEVYNLYPDYYYPGKIIGSKVDVIGEPEEDKTVQFEFTLNSLDIDKDGASKCYVRFYSEVGTKFDVWLFPKNGELDSVLVGSTTLSKHMKAGYWFLTDIQVYDPVGNARLENSATVGMKLFLNNPLEDITPPRYIAGTTELTSTQNNFTSSGSTDPDGKEYNCFKIEYDFYDDSPLNRVVTRVFFPTLDYDGVQKYSMDVQSLVDPNEYNSVKHGVTYLPVPEYFPSGYYSINNVTAEDVADNSSAAYLLTDTTDFVANGINKFKDIRDSVYFETPYPDYEGPILDLNDITVEATAVNPEAPDGETVVNIDIWVKDTSDYAGMESGLKRIQYILRDPQGIEHRMDAWDDLNEIAYNFYYQIESPFTAGEWRKFNLSTILPKGSAPGTWGVSSIQLQDRANNFRNYSFTEIVRFDLIQSDIVFDTAPFANINDNNIINSFNIDDTKLNFGCSPYADVNYAYRVYSDLGGSVMSGSGVMTNDSIAIEGLDFAQYLDGNIRISVQFTDPLQQLIGMVKQVVAKKVQIPVIEGIVYSENLITDTLTVDGYKGLQEIQMGIRMEGDDHETYTFELTSEVEQNVFEINDSTIHNKQVVDGDGIYTLTLRASDSCGNFDEYVFHVKTNATILAINENEIIENLSIFPNPTVGRVTIDFGSIQFEGSYRILSLSGRVVGEGVINNERTFDININSPEGIYLLKLEDKDGKQATAKLIKQ